MNILKRLFILVICMMSYLMIQTAGMTSEVMAQQYHRPRVIDILASWSPNTENDIHHYLVKFGQASGVYNDSIMVMHPDTSVQIFIQDSLKMDSLFAVVHAVDDAGNISAPSPEIACIPFVVYWDCVWDENGRIDIEDWRAIMDMVRSVWGKSIYRKTGR